MAQQIEFQRQQKSQRSGSRTFKKPLLKIPSKFIIPGVVVTSVPGLNVLWTFIPRNKSDRTEYTGRMCPIGQLIPGMKVWGVGRSVLKDGKIDYVLVIKVLLQCPGYFKLGPVIRGLYYQDRWSGPCKLRNNGPPNSVYRTEYPRIKCPGTSYPGKNYPDKYTWENIFHFLDLGTVYPRN